MEAEDQLFQRQGRCLEQGGEEEGSQEGRHGVAHEQVYLEQDFKENCSSVHNTVITVYN